MNKWEKEGLESLFHVGTKKALMPLHFGDPAEDCNCRCTALKKPRSKLDENELKVLKERAEFFGLDKTEDFKEFEKKYLKASKSIKNSEKYAIIKKGENSIGNDSYVNIFNDIVSKQSGIGKPYQDALSHRYSKGSDDARKAFNKYVGSDSVLDSAHTGVPHFSPAEQKIRMNFADDLQNKRGSGTTFFHEHGHFIDFFAVGTTNYNYISTNSAVFGSLLHSDFKNYVSTYKRYTR